MRQKPHSAFPKSTTREPDQDEIDEENEIISNLIEEIPDEINHEKNLDFSKYKIENIENEIDDDNSIYGEAYHEEPIKLPSSIKKYSPNHEEFIKLDFSQFPLYYYDHMEFEPLDLDVYNVNRNNTMEGYSPIYHEIGYIWSSCDVLEYNKENETFLIDIDGLKKNVRRINLLFK